jgi:hypothetical protein
MLTIFLAAWVTIGPHVYTKPMYVEDGLATGWIVIADRVKRNTKVEWQKDIKTDKGCFEIYKVNGRTYKLKIHCNYMRR